MALAAHGLHGLQGSEASAMHSATVFLAAHGLQGLQPARAMPVVPIAAIDIEIASAIGFRPERLVLLFLSFVVMLNFP